LISFDLRELANTRILSGKIGESCILWSTRTIIDSIRRSETSLSFKSTGEKPPIDCNFVIVSPNLKLRIMFSRSESTLIFGGNCTGNVDARLNNKKPRVIIGDNLVARGLRIAAHGRDMLVGMGMLAAEDTVLQGHDAHAIFEIGSREVLNFGDVVTEVGAHVWLARRSLVMPGVHIGKGSIVGAGSIVTKNIPQFSLAVGAPAKVIRSGVSWSRTRDTIDPEASSFIDRLPSRE
jgi:acetyltransferase-like isoleucine patch superfamily enzyme